MKMQCQWSGKMEFRASADGHEVPMDSKPPFGSDSALTPKQLLLAAICGCTAMDVVALLRKYKQAFSAVEIDADAPTTEGVQPAVFKEVKLSFRIDGQVDAEKAVEAVRLSQTRFCGVSAMVSKAVPISYTVVLNGTVVGEGHADFK